MQPSEDHPCYVISIAAGMVGVHEQTLRYYERVGLLAPFRSRGRHRLFSPRDIQKLTRIRRLIDDMGINLAGVQVVMKLMARIAEVEDENHNLKGQLSRFRRFDRESAEGGH